MSDEVINVTPGEQDSLTRLLEALAKLLEQYDRLTREYEEVVLELRDCCECRRRKLLEQQQ